MASRADAARSAVERFKVIDEAGEQLHFLRISGYVKVYAFLSQIIPTADAELENALQLRAFSAAASRLDRGEIVKVGDDVSLPVGTGFSGAITVKEGRRVHRLEVNGSGKAGDEDSAIRDYPPQRFGTEFKFFFFFHRSGKSGQQSASDTDSSRETRWIKFELGIRKLIEGFMIERMGENDKIVTRYMAITY